jgi:quercetin dioxygenase-like cupin family protein
MICYHDKIEKHDLGGGVVMQVLGVGDNMNVMHWDMEDGSIVEHHNHPEEQFGFVIKGELELTIEGEVFSVKAGDGYFVPASAWHSFVAIGETEAIDVFNPVKRQYANPRIDEILTAVIESAKG